MKSCLNVHGYWSSNRVPVGQKNKTRVPDRVPDYSFGNILLEHLFFYSCKKKTKTTKGVINANRKTNTKEIYGGNDQKAAEEKSKILCS